MRGTRRRREHSFSTMPASASEVHCVCVFVCVLKYVKREW